MVPNKIWELMPPDPKLEGQIRGLTKLIATKEQQRKIAIQRAYRKQYFYNRYTWDMEVNRQVEELLELRIQAAKLMVILCGKRETVTPDRIRQREESLGSDPFPLLIDRNQCLRYIGDEMLSYEERTFKYYRAVVLYNHFDRKCHRLCL
ncbi:hypothetical protein C7999DRAFT_45048 [Corynascus novoguineensis]|uniref:Uncharacterized protein n=1 Tax=Corynascus novoguineensis TaxID=1126955 RepID=A0AAN7CL46_9PEZI|nr:hypothetical protein C7999DRAFT_45048 [Corynascus novoguineensis]